MDKKEAIEIIKKYANSLKQNNFNFNKIILFGSFVRGNYNNDSDIDVAVIINDLKSSHEVLLNLMRLRRKIDTRIEPHPIDMNNFNENNPFVSDILKYGIEIK